MWKINKIVKLNQFSRKHWFKQLKIEIIQLFQQKQNFFLLN